MLSVQEIIVRLRARGLSQAEIGRRVGCPQPRISRWEAGNAPSSVDDSLRLKALLEEVEAVAGEAHCPVRD